MIAAAKIHGNGRVGQGEEALKKSPGGVEDHRTTKEPSVDAAKPDENGSASPGGVEDTPLAMSPPGKDDRAAKEAPKLPEDYDVVAPPSKEDRMKKALLTVTLSLKVGKSDHPLLQRIHRAINVANDDGSRLVATALSGGYTNYSYRVRVDKHPELCLFAKFCFEKAITPHGEVTYDLRRTDNEYEMLQTMASKTPDCVAPPIACWDVKHQGQKMKLLLAEWADGDEQFAHQFIDGAVDPRIAPKIAYALATLHCIPSDDPKFKEDLARPHMMHLLEHMRNIAKMASKTKNAKVQVRTQAYCAELGESTVMKMMDAVVADYGKRECLIHSDAHVFNILVEAKPSIEELEAFGPHGSVAICDWEMATVGPVGMDVGLALSFPIGCMIAHALNGHEDANASIEEYVNTLIDTYLSMHEELGKKPDDVTKILRNIVGWCGWYLYLGFYILNAQPAFPIDEDDDVARNRLRDALGILGLKLMRISFDLKYLPRKADHKKVRKEFNAFRSEEVKHARDVFASGRQRNTPRKSSVFRVANRRLSDTSMLMAADSLRRLSVSTRYSKKMERLSIAENVAESMKSLSMTDDMERIHMLWGEGGDDEE